MPPHQPACPHSHALHARSTCGKLNPVNSLDTHAPQDPDAGAYASHHTGAPPPWGATPGRDTYPESDQRGAPTAGAAGTSLSFGSMPAGSRSATPPPGLYAPPACNPGAPPNAGAMGAPARGGGGVGRATDGGGGGGGGGPAAHDNSVLPESTPAPVADPAEASMLATYLRLVQETHGSEAAATAAASSGAGGSPGGGAYAAAAAQLLSAPYTAPPGGRAPSSRSSSRPASADAHRARGAAAAVAAGGGDAGGGGSEVVSSMLGFIKERKLATNNPPQRRPSAGGDSTASSASSSAGSKGSMKIWIQPSGES